ncbi:hypothetical protein ASPBRDRAFT_49534 [Aspergillus brasiliensis CBS 101740]|uniref:Uncharacterized protein n=1 Tax=Aspergillus brasiliensis (strain CBS 101740 / IMI 381727 / IBT 21946) TaxID=767769 RepID=A0A1L9U218_ASPBC|nr:hypothetical protein ASPBRDRAFT_49534 [Aspergillus brasiliensis CBS 101740]
MTLQRSDRGCSPLPQCPSTPGIEGKSHLANLHSASWFFMCHMPFARRRTMFALLIRLPGPIEKFAEHPDMVFEMKERISTLHRVLSQLLILLQWFAAYFPEHFYLGAPGIPDRKSSSSPRWTA